MGLLINPRFNYSSQDGLTVLSGSPKFSNSSMDDTRQSKQNFTGDISLCPLSLQILTIGHWICFVQDTQKLITPGNPKSDCILVQCVQNFSCICHLFVQYVLGRNGCD